MKAVKVFSTVLAMLVFIAAFLGACSRLKLSYYSHRAFRRMFVTRALEKGIDVKVIADWQGHGDGGKLILDTYSHVRRPHAEAMAARMADDSCSEG